MPIVAILFSSSLWMSVMVSRHLRISTLPPVRTSGGGFETRRCLHRLWRAPDRSDGRWPTWRRGRWRGERVIIVWINGRPRPRRVCPGNGCLSRLGPGECDWRKVDARRETHCSLTLSTLIFAVDPYHGSYFDHGRGGRGSVKTVLVVTTVVSQESRNETVTGGREMVIGLSRDHGGMISVHGGKHDAIGLDRRKPRVQCKSARNLYHLTAPRDRRRSGNPCHSEPQNHRSTKKLVSFG